MMGTKRHNVLISGGMGDIGKAIAVKLAAEGYRIILLAHHSNPEDVDLFLDGLFGEEHLCFACDIANEKEIRSTIQQVIENAGSVDVCIHAAVSPIVRKNASTITEAEFRQQFEVSLFGGFNLFHSVMPFMKEQGIGRIIGITTSVVHENSSAGMAGYVSAKYALHGLLRELSKEFGGTGVSVSSLAPGFVMTKLHNDLPQVVRGFLKERMPSRTPEEVASAIAWICGESQVETNGRSYSVETGKPSILSTIL